MLVHVIFEDLEALYDLPAYVHSAAFVDIDDASKYISEQAVSTVEQAENENLSLEYSERKVDILHNGHCVGTFEIQTVDVQ